MIKTLHIDLFDFSFSTSHGITAEGVATPPLQGTCSFSSQAQISASLTFWLFWGVVGVFVCLFVLIFGVFLVGFSPSDFRITNGIEGQVKQKLIWLHMAVQ